MKQKPKLQYNRTYLAYKELPIWTSWHIRGVQAVKEYAQLQCHSGQREAGADVSMWKTVEYTNQYGACYAAACTCTSQNGNIPHPTLRIAHRTANGASILTNLSHSATTFCSIRATASVCVYGADAHARGCGDAILVFAEVMEVMRHTAGQAISCHCRGTATKAES